MRVAVPLYGDLVSPRFGSEVVFLIASIEEGQLHEEQTVEARNLGPSRLAELLVSLGVTKVICGGIQHELQRAIERRGIDVIWGIIGPASDALAALLAGSLHSDQFVRRSGKAAGKGTPSGGPGDGHPVQGARRPGKGTL